MKWDPTVLKEKVERSLFRHETKVIKKTMKPELVQKFEEINKILYYQEIIAQENQLKYEIITPNGLKLGQNNYSSLEGSGIKLDKSSNLRALLKRNRELYCEWYRIFFENIHMLDLRPNKWLTNRRSLRQGF